MREFASPHRSDARPPVRSRRGWLWLVLALLAVIAGFIASAPYLLKYGLERWLLQRGASEVTLGALHVNPFTGTIEVDRLRVRDHRNQLLDIGTLRGRFVWRALGQRRLAFDRMEVRDARLLLDKRLLHLLPEPGAAPWPLQVQGLQLAEVEFTTSQNATPLRIHQGSVEVWSSQPSTPIDISIAGTLYDAPLRVRWHGSGNATDPAGDMQLEIEGLDLSHVAASTSYRGWQGRVTANLHLSARRDADGRTLVSQEGTVRAQGLEWVGEHARLQLTSAVWAGNGQVRVDGEAVHLQQQGQLNAAAPALETAHGRYHSESLEWHGSLRADAAPDRPVSLQADGMAQANNLNYVPAQAGAQFQARRLHWRGPLGYGTADVPGGWSAQGTLQLTDASLTRAQAPSILLAAARAVLQGVDVKGTYAVQAQALELWNYRALATADPDGRAVVVGNQASLEALTLVDRNRFRADRLTLDGMQLLLEKTARGEWFGLAPGSWLAAPDNSGRLASLRIGRVALAGDNNRLVFTDSNVRPRFSRRFQIRELTLADLDTATPNQPSPFAIHAHGDDGSRLVAVGKLMPFSDPMNVSLKTKITALPLGPLDAYSIQHLGFGLSGGVARIDSDMHVIDGKLRTKTQLRVRNLQLKPAPGTGTQAFRDSVAMPLPLAIHLLQDERQRIAVTVPLRGDLQSDDFQFGVAFDHALGAAVRRSVLALVGTRLHPFGIAGTPNRDGLRLEPVRFRTGSAELNQVSRTYLRRLGSLLRARAAVHVYICGSTDVGESTEQRSLAQQRGEAVKTTLTGEENIDPGRLELCATSASATDAARAELILK